MRVPCIVVGSRSRLFWIRNSCETSVMVMEWGVVLYTMRFNAVLLYANLMSLFNSISFGDSCVVRVLRSLHRGCIRCSHAAAATVALKYDECTGVGLARIAWIGIIFVIRMLMPLLLSNCPSRATERERACPGRYCLNLGPDHISSRTPRNDNPIPLSPEPPCRARRMADHSSPTQACSLNVHKFHGRFSSRTSSFSNRSLVARCVDIPFVPPRLASSHLHAARAPSEASRRPRGRTLPRSCRRPCGSEECLVSVTVFS